MEQYLGEIRLVGFTFAPIGWLLCQGQTVPISGNEALYTLIGTTYGGDGQSTFMLPDLRGRAPVHAGTNTGTSYVLGQTGGAEQVSLAAQNVPPHTHTVSAASNSGGQGGNNSPAGNVFGADPSIEQYELASNGVTGPLLSPSQAGMQPHENRMPYLAVNYIISTQGVFPSQG